jgi:hypothetical protein
MEIVGWLVWALLSLLGMLWTVVWFLISGWVATLLQILVLVAAVFFFRYGWQRAPGELVRRGRALARFGWGWLRAADAQAPGAMRDVVRIVRVKEFGDINVSTLLSLLTLAGLALLTTLR